MPGEKNVHVVFDIAEDHPHWEEVRSLLRKWGESEGSVRTEFSKKEIHDARWLKMNAWHHGYPQPDSAFGYREVTYDLSDACEECDLGRKQKAPFRMKREPRWGRRGIMQLTWVYDEIFVTPEVWKKVFEPHGIGYCKVMNTKGVELQTVVQLVVDERVSIKTEGLAFEECERCGRKKYLPVARGPFPPMVSEPMGLMVKTNEYFGSDGNAYRCILISQEIAQSLAVHEVRGADLRPVAE